MPITRDQAIEFCRTLNRKAADKYAEKGIAREDIMSGALHATFDIACVLTEGDWVAAINLIRDGLDGIERELMEKALGNTLQ